MHDAEHDAALPRSSGPTSEPARRPWMLGLGALLGLGLAGLGTGLLSGCALTGQPDTVLIGPDELQRLVERSFPLDRRLLDVLEVSIDSPRITLLSDRNRLATTLGVSTRDRLFGGRWSGRIALDSALRWEPSDHSLRLAQVRVQSFELDGGGSLARTQAERLGAVLAERVLEDFALYRLSDERADTLRRSGRVPSAVTVTHRGVLVTFAPPVR
ncbi:MAG: hypothetical protein ACOVQT_01060 [Rubrivivax sp.]|jgi:hypothetical protein